MEKQVCYLGCFLKQNENYVKFNKKTTYKLILAKK
jgi:hypothetical protein